MPEEITLDARGFLREEPRSGDERSGEEKRERRERKGEGFSLAASFSLFSHRGERKPLEPRYEEISVTLFPEVDLNDDAVGRSRYERSHFVRSNYARENLSLRRRLREPS